VFKKPATDPYPEPVKSSPHSIYFRSSSSFSLFLMPSHASDFLFYLWILRHLVGLLGWGISPAPRPLPTHRTTQRRETQTHIHASSRIRTCDPNVRAAEDSTCLRPRGYWDWRL